MVEGIRTLPCPPKSSSLRPPGSTSHGLRKRFSKAEEPGQSKLSKLSMRYRPNAALILLNDQGEILLGERLDTQDSWQFPQGGAKRGEPLDRALVRETREEIGLRAEAFEMIERHGPFRYQFPGGLKKNGCIGQEQIYFLSRLRPGYHLPAGPIDSPEFRRLRWIFPADFQLDWVADFKREVYRCVFHEVFGVELPLPEGCSSSSEGGRGA